jgi:hypothetical protein
LIDHLFTSAGDQVTRVVKCTKHKGDTEYKECRYFTTGKEVVCVQLIVFDEPKENRKLEHLLAHLRSHYGYYEGVCQQVAEVVFAKK